MKTFNCLVVVMVLGIMYLTLSSLTVSTTSSPATYEDSVAADRAKHIKSVKAAIAGKEKLPADSVFKNIQILKGMPAERLLAIMDMGYSQSLGVSCGHCHNTGDFKSDEKPEKQIAREMNMLTKTIREQLTKIKNIKSVNPVVNCTTCHRGQVKPALSLGAITR